MFRHDEAYEERMAALESFVTSKIRVKEKYTTTSLLKQIFNALVSQDMELQLSDAATSEHRPMAPGKDDLIENLDKYSADDTFETWNLPPQMPDSLPQLRRFWKLQYRRR